MKALFRRLGLRQEPWPELDNPMIGFRSVLHEWSVYVDEKGNEIDEDDFTIEELEQFPMEGRTAWYQAPTYELDAWPHQFKTLLPAKLTWKQRLSLLIRGRINVLLTQHFDKDYSGIKYTFTIELPADDNFDRGTFSKNVTPIDWLTYDSRNQRIDPFETARKNRERNDD